MELPLFSFKMNHILTNFIHFLYCQIFWLKTLDFKKKNLNLESDINLYLALYLVF